MRNAIKHYYNLEPVSIHQNNKELKFNINNVTYILMHCNRNNDEIIELYKLSLSLYQKGVLCHQFILNINNTIITFINDEPYVLFKTYIINNRQININDIIQFSNETIVSDENKLRRDNWHSLWTNKIDYFEYQISQFGKEHPLIRESFSYFIGIAETSITLYNNVNNNYERSLSVGHKRIPFNYTLLDLYNPLNFIIDYKIRNIAEYFKSIFFNDNGGVELIQYYIENEQLNPSDYLALYTRLLFPTYYFDVYETIILEKKDEKLLIPIITRIKNYENMLRYILKCFNNIIDMPSIEWLN